MLIKAIVRDENANPIPCRLALYRAEGSAPVAEADCIGEHLFAVPQGAYRLDARRGKLWQPASCDVVSDGSSALAELTLKRLFDPADWGLLSFDGHSHISRDANKTDPTLAEATMRMRAEDFNLFFAGSPWDADVHFQYLQGRMTDNVPYRQKYGPLIEATKAQDFLLDIGNELAKGRYGHLFLMNFNERPPYNRYYDRNFDDWLWEKDGDTPQYKIAYPYEAIARERGGDGAAVAAHPTSWWWHDNGQFIPNIAATIGFDVLAGAVDALVIMGYQAERPGYQALWYDLLNNGYYLPGIAETDVVFDRVPVKYLQFKTYAQAKELTPDAICHAVKAGRCVATSGPLLRMTVDGAPMGSVLPHKSGQRFTLRAEAVACCDGPLREAQIIINGEVFARHALQGERSEFEQQLTVDGDSFVLVKLYDKAGNIAITNPVYLRNAPFVNIGYRAQVHIQTQAAGQYRLDDGAWQPFDGDFALRMPPAATLTMEANGCQRTIKLFELPELQAIFRNLYLGHFNADKAYEPGEVPAEFFAVRQIREMLDDVRIVVEFEQI